jgi:hypothetical protein
VSDLLDDRQLEAVSPSYAFARQETRIDGVPFNLARYPFLAELYDEPWPSIVIRKCAQVGLTSWAILTVIHRMVQGIYPRGVLYVFPSDDEVYDFAQSRFDRLLSDNDSLRGIVRGTDRTALKNIGGSMLYFRGMRSKTKLLSIPVDAIVYDEFDEMDPEMIAISGERLSGSEVRHKLRLGHPTIPGYGIDYEYGRSDQRVWMIRCSACNEWTCLELEFPDCVKQRGGEYYRACRNCEGRLEIVDGQWVAREKDRETRGYWISQLLSPTVPLKSIMERHEHVQMYGRDLGGAPPHTFWNMVMGMPFADIDDTLDELTIRAICDKNRPPAAASEGPCWLGADLGKRDIFPVIGVRRAADQFEYLRFEPLSSFDDLFDLAKKFNVRCGVLDEMAEARAVMDFKRRASWCWGAVYTEGNLQHVSEWDPKDRKVRIHRTASLDQSHRDITQGRAHFPRETEYFRKNVMGQLCNLCRVIMVNARTGQQTARWVIKGTKNDHWRHSVNYARVAAERVSVARERATVGKYAKHGYPAQPETWEAV